MRLRQREDTSPEKVGRIRHLPPIVAFRDVLIHGHAAVDDRLAWDVAQTRLPELRATLHALPPRD